MPGDTRFFSSTLILLLTIIPSDGFSQGDEHTKLVGHLDFGEYTSDIWGYTDITTGIDYALLGARGGMAIIDATTDTANPTQVAYVTGAFPSFLKDIKTWKNYSYLVSEGGSGLEIVNLTDPTSPVLIKNLTADFTTAHNLYIDEGGFAYVVGANTNSGGLIIYDLTDPENPVRTGQWVFDRIHDVIVSDNIAWASVLSPGSIVVIDVSDKSSPTEITRWVQGSSTHQAWLTEDSNYLLVTEERVGGHLKIWDVSDLNNITKVSEYESIPNVIIHNVFVKGDFAYISYLVEGLKILDISDPVIPGEVGDFDIFPGSNFANNGFAGAWGVFPYTSSGLIFVGDMEGSFTTARFDLYHIITGTDDEIPVVANKYSLDQNFPNPFNPETTLEYTLQNSGEVSLIIYNLLGQEMTRLVNEVQKAGNHQVTWNASNVASGIYFYRLQAGDFVQTRKMVLLK